MKKEYEFLDKINFPSDLKKIKIEDDKVIKKDL